MTPTVESMDAYGEGPPLGGIWLQIAHEPVSLQARRLKKNSITAAVKAVLGLPGYLLTGDVTIAVEWLVRERARYETGTSPDVDNVIKVLLDALWSRRPVNK